MELQDHSTRVQVIAAQALTDDLGRTLTFEYNRGATPSPDDELLHQITGPAGTKLVFTYSRPPITPEKLNEEFLVRVDRTDAPIAADVVAAPTRSIAYGYQWPEVPGSITSAQLAQNAQAVRVPYQSYFAAFTGCKRFSGPAGGCGSGISPALVQVEGDPTLLAEEQVRDYISDVFDNIIKVDQTGVTESETRYQADPMSLDFDRVSAQRYGARQAQASAVALPAEIPAVAWTTSLPRMTFSYFSAGPTGAGDRTDSLLPPEIASRYPLESPPTPPELSEVPEQQAAIDGETCHLDQIGALRAALPGYHKIYKYYEDTPRFSQGALVAGTSPLKRAQLSCDTLSLAQISDPTHNDLLSDLEPIPNPDGGTTIIAYARRIVGQRGRVATDANRICAWSKVIDRDGDLHYYGLNYRGQALVSAVKERSADTYIYTERLFNSDGYPVMDRRPTGGASQWAASDGYTQYTYDEQGLVGSSAALNDWLPVFWTRRGNLLSITDIPRGGSVTDIDEGTGVIARTSIGRYKQMLYEPLFNQLRSVEEGSLNSSGSKVASWQTDYVFDYQELGLTSLKPILDELRPWGFRWMETNATPPGYDYPAIQWQLPVHFYATDLNGDGQIGPYGRTSAWGLPILAVRRGLNGEHQEYAMTWAPNGKPAGIAGPDGSLVLFDYYSIAATGQGPYGLGTKPADSELAGGHRSFLARIRTKRFAAPTLGPSSAPCASLAGPYQWLLPSSCSSNPASDLLALGLPAETADALTRIASGSAPDNWRTTWFGYSVLGKVSHSWSDVGETSVVRDTDGRETTVNDELSNRTTTLYNHQGLPISTTRADKFGARIGETRRQFDDEGKVTYRCSAKSAGGCLVVGAAAAPDGIEEHFEYGPEGTLNLEVDGEGLRTVHAYDERQQLRSSIASKPPAPATRQVTYQYTLDGDVQDIRHGDTSTYLLEHVDYDGLRRPKKYVDKRGYSWHFGFSDRDLLTRYKQDSDTAPYSSGPSSPNWESTFAYDWLGRRTTSKENGLSTTVYSRTNGGNIYKVERTGLSPSYATYDLDGQPVWESDGVSNQVVRVSSYSPYLDSTVEVRLDGAGGKHSTSRVSWLDAAGQVTETMEYASGKERRTSFLRNGSGFVKDQTDTRGFHTLFEPNFLGWPDTVKEQSPSGYDVAHYTYNGRGQVTSVIDPGGLETSLEYDGFGAVISRTLHTSPLEAVTFTYDALGRLATRTSAMSSVLHHYNFRGDPDFERFNGSSQKLSSRTFDSLGRVVDSINFNPALTWLPEQKRMVSRGLTYDALGRVASDTLAVGQAPAGTVTSTWSLSGGTWKRELRHPGAAATPDWTESYDGAGRLSLETRPNGAGTLATSFDFEGPLYTGRRQQLPGWTSQFTEDFTLDELGQTVGIRYGAQDVTASGQPRYPAEGSVYCGGTWAAADCSGPLLEVALLRDKVGRVVSDKPTFGYPVLRGNSGPRVAGAPHARPWRGFAYLWACQLPSEIGSESEELAGGAFFERRDAPWRSFSKAASLAA